MNARVALVAMAGDAGDETALVARIRLGDEEAFGTFFRTHYVALLAFVQSQVGDAAVAEELVQQVFWGIWQNRNTLGLRGTGSVRSYLYQAARNQTLNYRARRRVEQAWVADIRQQGEALSAPADSVMHEQELAGRIRQAVHALPSRCREVFVLSRGHDLSNAEIADALGISRKTVEQQLWRALTALRRMLK